MKEFRPSSRRSRRRHRHERHVSSPWEALGHTWQRLGLQLAELGSEGGIEGMRATAAALSSFADELHFHVGGAVARAQHPAGSCGPAPVEHLHPVQGAADHDEGGDSEPRS